MRLRFLPMAAALAFAGLLTGTVSPVMAQRGGASNWELLGEEKVGLGADHDVIRLNNDENFYRNKAYRRLRFVAQGGEVKMKAIRLVYINGHAEDLQFSQTLRPGQEIEVDLRGERSYLRQIEMFYKSKFGISLGGGGIRVNQASIKAFGENVRGGPPPRPEPPRGRPGALAGWDELDVQRFDRTADRVVMTVGRREGRVAQILLRADGEAITVRSLRIAYANGSVQDVAVAERLEFGQSTRPIDLDGDRRFIERVVVNLEGRRRPGPAALALFGKGEPPRGGNFGGRGSWVPLGEASVGFRIDRDVIRVGQSEDWFRNRGFDRLHFVAENNDVHMLSIRVVYLNGFGEDYKIDSLIRAGSDLAVDLRGRRSFIREVEMLYRKRDGFGGRAVVKVFGEPPRR